jgi:DnaJ-class molecular chaperone
VESATGIREVQPFESFECYAPSFEEILDRFWSSFDSLARPKAERLESLTLEIPLSRRQAATGGRIRVLVPAQAVCSACHGTGVVPPYECWRCLGHGSLTGEHPIWVAYPPGVQNDYVLQLALDHLGISNFYLTLRFRVTDREIF